MTTPRSVRDQIQNVLDYLSDAELATFITGIRMTGSRLTWQSHRPEIPFFSGDMIASVAEYHRWVSGGHYSALLIDGSLLQITYDVRNGEVVGHRLGYVPCPFEIDLDLLDEGHALADIVDLYSDVNDVALRSPIRFDFDPSSARSGHPASHMTINTADCRIACVAPLHVLRFVDFVYRNFYPELWRAHKDFFTAGTFRHLSKSSLHPEDGEGLHLSWDVHSQEAG